ncbi:hypothetical protein A1O7_02976 [Cladophialophora yegresii CBS 114405]|uniref:Uncharacterized protein n=1 Tax=Cladophialophora yegresii CBS 114405 TaxID=1182544 RepID=W9W3L7_9EURO|nr:uncharacterized protein A1O7_02976 [Cladophialophora yegresii CBS 114405]EXJ62538.1 hypothetical protein A1O7_02976 [Cladophialophora yegresii CBS 114405]
MALGTGFTFVGVDGVVDVVGRFAGEKTLHGRAMMITPEQEGVIDVRDDEEGVWGGVIFGGIQERMRPAGLII